MPVVDAKLEELNATKPPWKRRSDASSLARPMPTHTSMSLGSALAPPRRLTPTHSLTSVRYRLRPSWASFLCRRQLRASELFS
jgi:hypothetical protein